MGGGGVTYNLATTVVLQRDCLIAPPKNAIIHPVKKNSWKPETKARQAISVNSSKQEARLTFNTTFYQFLKEETDLINRNLDNITSSQPLFAPLPVKKSGQPLYAQHHELLHHKTENCNLTEISQCSTVFIYGVTVHRRTQPSSPELTILRSSVNATPYTPPW